MPNLLDFRGEPIRAGDLVIYTAAGRGRNLPPLEMGEVIGLTKAGVRVKKLNKDYTTIQVQDGFFEKTGKKIQSGTYEYEETRFVKTEMRDVVENIRYYPDRFIKVEWP